MVLTGLGTALPAQADTEYTLIPQSRMKAVAADSVEAVMEPGNGPIDKILDGDVNGYWHTKWSSAKDKLPHWFVIRLGDSAVNLGKLDVVPRQSSTGSGRVHEYQVFATNTTNCGKDAFTNAPAVAKGSFHGEVAHASDTRTITLSTPVTPTPRPGDRRPRRCPDHQGRQADGASAPRLPAGR